MNKFLNENADDVNKEIGKPVIEALNLIVKNCFDYITERNTVNDMFV